MNIQGKFIDWITGRTNAFPFFKDVAEVPMPVLPRAPFRAGEDPDDDEAEMGHVEDPEMHEGKNWL